MYYGADTCRVGLEGDLNQVSLNAVTPRELPMSTVTARMIGATRDPRHQRICVSRTLPQQKPSIPSSTSYATNHKHSSNASLPPSNGFAHPKRLFCRIPLQHFADAWKRLSQVQPARQHIADSHPFFDQRSSPLRMRKRVVGFGCFPMLYGWKYRALRGVRVSVPFTTS